MRNDIASIMLYSLVGLICFFFSKRINRRPKRMFWSIVILLSVLAGVRNSSVGVDAFFYETVLRMQKNGFIMYASNIKELGYLAYSYIISKVSSGYTLLFLVTSFIINYFIIKRLYEERQRIDFSYAIIIYYLHYFFMTFNTMRQWIAVAIVFYFSRYIGKNKKGIAVFCLSVAVAFLFHKSALIAIAIAPFYYLVQRNKGIKSFLMKLLVIIAVPFVFSFVENFFSVTYGMSYTSTRSGGVSAVTIIRLLFFALIAFEQYRINPNLLKVDNNFEGASEERIIFANTYRLNLFCYFVGLVLTLGTYFYYYMDRVGHYFVIFELLVLPFYAKQKWCGQSVKLFVITVFLFLRVMSFMSNGYAELPYVPFWR